MSRADDFLLTAEELRLRRVRRRRWFSVVLVLLLLLVLGIFAARPTRRAIKAWQSHRHAEKAFRFIEEEKWTEAGNEARAAYQLRPTEPTAIRAVARFLSRIRQSQALEFWDRLAKREPLTREDLRDRASVALAVNELTVADETMHALLGARNGGPVAADWLLAAQLAAQRSAAEEAEKNLAKVFADPRATDRQQFQASALQLMIGGNLETETTKKLQTEAWARLTKIAEGQSAAALDALVLLGRRALTGGTTAVSSPSPGGAGAVPSPSTNTDATAGVPPVRIAHALETHPLAQAPQKLLAIDLRIHAAPNEKAALIQAAVDRWKGAEVKSLVALATWLNGHGEYQRELDTIPPQRAVQDKDLFLQRLDALGALGRWQEIKQALNSESFPLDPMVTHMYLARCNAQLGEKTAAENNWQRALEASTGDAAKSLTLADYAEKNGAISIAASAYDGAVATAPKLRVAWQGKLRLAQVTRDTKTIHAVLVEMLKQWPNDTSVQNDEAYTRVLLLPSGNAEDRSQKSEVSSSSLTSDLRPPSSEFVQIERLARDLIQHDPTSLPHRTLLALVYLKQNRPATALGVYENIHVPTNALTPSGLTIHAAVLQANGNLDDAEKEVAQVPRSAILAEEAALISGL